MIVIISQFDFQSEQVGSQSYDEFIFATYFHMRQLMMASMRVPL